MNDQLAVFSSKRSTHHAFLESLLKGKNYVYKNNCIVKQNRDVVPTKVVSEGGDGLIVASFEQNFCLQDLFDYSIYSKLGMDGGNVKKVLYLRDPLNTAASSYSIYKKVDKYDIDFVNRNLIHYCSIFGSVLERDDVLFVYANKFWSDMSYRKNVLDWIGMSESTSSYTKKQSYFGGGGNSFFENKDSVAPEDLSSRFLKFKDDDEFLYLVEEYDLVSKAAQLARKYDDASLLEYIDKFIF